MYKVSKTYVEDETKAREQLKKFKARFTKNDLARMYYKNHNEESNIVKIYCIDVEVINWIDGTCAFSVDMVIENTPWIDKIHFWVDYKYGTYAYNKDPVLEDLKRYRRYYNKE